MKHAKKLLCLLLVLSMALTLLTACKKDEEAEVKTTDITLSEYTLIRGAKCGTVLNTAANLFQKAVEEALGTEFASEKDSKVEANAESKEILLGLTNREESTKAQTDLGDKFAYSIRVTDNKITIMGATNELIVKGLNDLQDRLSQMEGGVLKVPTDYTVEKEYHELVTNGVSNYKMVYSVNDGGGENFGTVKYIKGLIDEYTKEEIPWNDDYLQEGDSHDLTKKAIVVGLTTYPHSQELTKDLGLFSWVMDSKDDLLYLCAYEKNAFIDMSGELADRLEGSILLSTAEAEYKTLRMCKVEKVGKDANQWDTAIPMFTGGDADVFRKIEDGYYRMRYDNSSKDAFNAYVTTLASEGFTLYDNNDIDGNLFNTYYKGDVMLHTYYLHNEKSVSLVITSASKAPKYSLTPYSDGEVTDANLQLMDMNYGPYIYESGKKVYSSYDHNNGMGFIFTMSDGSYVVVDGGHTNDAEGIYNYMKENNKRADGKILIRAWILTHPDSDHYGAPVQFAKKYSSEAKLEYFVAQHHYGTYESGGTKSTVDNINSAMEKFAGCRRLVPLAGQTMYFGEAEFTFLNTPELANERTLDNNEMSLIINVSFEGKKILMMADAVGAATIAANRLYSDAFQADFYQAAHHALDPCAIDSKARASAIIFCTHEVAATDRRSRYEGLLNAGAEMIIADHGYQTLIP